jgi:UDP-N-acetylglucosamine--N-acetylmuramyl-(pentapeptide) pyrophosphoryl-undecaprenol N-acetylglucosamine transferase
LLVHEQNAIPGTTNRILARLATRVMEAFPGTFEPERRAIQTGNPVREDIATLPVPELRFGRRRGGVRLLVIGGSQGAQALNEIVPLALARLAPERRPDVWHQTGRGHEAATQDNYARAGVTAHLVPFFDNMAEAYNWADVAICRAGAMTISELAAAGLGAILVPYPHAVDDHQTENAFFLAEAGAAISVQQRDLSAESLEAMLTELFANGRQKLLKMAKAARQLAQPQAASVVARTCMEVGRG